jgi:catechol 2,3-dioxygenase-like lactoylglutathione lyase family enzyme
VPGRPLLQGAFPYQDDVLALPVVDLDATARWYTRAFGLREVERREDPNPAVILERDGVKLGFAVNGGDPSQDGAAILVSDVQRAKEELEAAGIAVGDLQVEDHDGEERHAFFVVAPDGLCYYFYQPLPKT